MNIKQELHAMCLQILQQKIAEIEAAIAERRAAIANETKSSMGDKYETTREMLQQEINMNLERLNKVLVEIDILNKIDTGSRSQAAVNGSVVITNNGNYYIAVGAGKLLLNKELYYSVSVSSPIGVQLKGKTKRDTFYFNNREYIIQEIL